MTYKYFDLFKSLSLTFLRLVQSRFCLGLIIYSSWIEPSEYCTKVPMNERVFLRVWAPLLARPKPYFLFPVFLSKGNFPVIIGIPLGMLFANIWSSYTGLHVESVCVRQTRFQEARQRNKNGRRRERNTAFLVEAPQSTYTFKLCKPVNYSFLVLSWFELGFYHL